MADLHLSRPAAGASQIIPCAPGARFVFDFPAADAAMTRSGDDLVFTFADGSGVVLQDFYKVYNRDQLPGFAMEGADVAAADFFAAMGQEDLMPAAGHAQGRSAHGHGHYSEQGSMELLGGLKGSLDGEDVGWTSGGIIWNVPEAAMAEPADEEEPLPLPEPEAFSVSLAAQDTDEGAATLRFVLTLDRAAQSDITAVVSVGGREFTVAFPAGETEAVLDVPNTFNTEDAYTDPGSAAARIVSVSGGEGVEVSIATGSAEAQIADTTDDTQVTITGKDIVEGRDAVFTVTLSNPAQTDAVVTVEAGGVEYAVKIAAGESSGTFTMPIPDDVYADASTLTATLTGIEGGNFEKTTLGEAATISIDDTINNTNVTISGTDISEGQDAVFTVSLSNPAESDATVSVEVAGTEYRV